jgi:DNA-binding PadR family transcriptional regulator
LTIPLKGSILYIVRRYIVGWNMHKEGNISLPDVTPNYLPLSEPAFYILLSLADGEKHGYAILKVVQALSNGATHLSSSTLYEGLNRLLESGLIERVEAAAPPESRRPRKAYRLSRQGRLVLQAETARMQRLVELARGTFAEGKP